MRFKWLFLIFIIFFIGCTQVIFISNTKDLWKLGVPNCRIIKIEKIECDSKEQIFRVTYKNKTCQDVLE